MYSKNTVAYNSYIKYLEFINLVLFEMNGVSSKLKHWKDNYVANCLIDQENLKYIQVKFLNSKEI